MASLIDKTLPPMSLATDQGYCLESHEPVLSGDYQKFLSFYYDVNKDQLSDKAQTQLTIIRWLFEIQRYFKPDSNHTHIVTTPSGVEFELYEDFLKCGDHDKISSGRLVKNTFVNGAWIREDKPVTFHDNLAFESGIFDEDLSTGFYDDGDKEVVFAQGHPVTFYDDESLEYGASIQSGYLKEKVKIHGFDFLPETRLEFHQTGELSEGFLSEDRQIHGILFAGDNTITFYETGEFRSGTLLFDMQIGHHFLKAGDRIRLNEDGSFRGFYLQEEKEVGIEPFGSIMLVEESWLEYHADDQVARFTPKDYLFIQIGSKQIWFKGGEEIQFYKNGQLRSGTLLYDTMIPDYEPQIEWAAERGIVFYENGNLEGSFPKDDLVLKDYHDDNGNPVVLAAGEWTYFYEDKIFRGGRLKEDTSFAGLLFAKGEQVTFSPDKSFRNGVLKDNTVVFEGLYGGRVILAGGQRAGFKDRSHHFYGHLFQEMELPIETETVSLTVVLQKNEEIQFHDNGMILGGRPTDVVHVDSELSFIDWVEFNDEGKFIGGILANSLDRDGHHLETEQYAEFYPSGAVLGYKVKKEFNPYPDLYPELWLGGDRWVEFHEGTDLVKGAKLSEEFVVDHDFFGEIWLAKNEWAEFSLEGILQGGKLADDVSLDLPGFENLILAKGEWVDFYEDGSLKGGNLSEDAIYHHPFYGSIEFKAGKRMEFYQDGSFKGAVLAEKKQIPNSRYGSIDLLEDNWIEFYEDGLFKSGTLEDEIYILNPYYGGFYIAKGKGAEFYPLENLEKGVLSEDTKFETTLGGIWFLGAEEEDGDYETEFHQNDKIKAGFLGGKYVIDGVKFYFGDWIEFDWEERVEFQ